MASYFAHESSYVDDNVNIGENTKIWHFSHIMSNCVIGDFSNIGQNVVVSPDVVLGKNVKVQNNVSIYTGVTCDDDVFLGPSMVFTNVINPRSAVNRKSEYYCPIDASTNNRRNPHNYHLRNLLGISKSGKQCHCCQLSQSASKAIWQGNFIG